MNHVYHILNGDALLSQFPATIKGDKLVCRECFVEGPVSKSSLTSFFNERKTTSQKITARKLSWIMKRMLLPNFIKYQPFRIWPKLTSGLKKIYFVK